MPGEEHDNEQDVVDEPANRTAERPRRQSTRRKEELTSHLTSREVKLPLGEALTIPEANELAQRSGVRVIAVAAPVGSGKTTLLTSMFDHLQAGPIGHLSFAGSATLIGFERRCHAARATSARAMQTTERTPAVEQPEFLHLRLKSSEGAQRTFDILMPDVSGEAFDRAKDSEAELQLLTFLSRADSLVVLLDGERLASRTERQVVRSDALTFIRTCLDCGIVGSEARLDVVVTKVDLLGPPNEDRGEVGDFLSTIEAALRHQTTGRISFEGIQEVAARPDPQTGYDMGHGLTPLVEKWTQDYRRPSPTPVHIAADARRREFLTALNRESLQGPRVSH